jgi:hypothetical protein
LVLAAEALVAAGLGAGAGGGADRTHPASIATAMIGMDAIPMALARFIMVSPVMEPLRLPPVPQAPGAGGLPGVRCRYSVLNTEGGFLAALSGVTTMVAVSL